MTKPTGTKLRDKMKHSAQAFRRNAPKEGRGGKGTWGNPLDDINYTPVVALDQGDPNFVPDEIPEDYDAFEEDVWHADNEGYDAFFGGYVEDDAPPVTMTEQVAGLRDTSLAAMDMLLAGELEPESVVDFMKERGNFTVGTGSLVAKAFFLPRYMSHANREVLALAMENCLQQRTINMANVDNAFLAAFDQATAEDTAMLGEFAEILANKGIFNEEKLSQFKMILETEDFDDFLRDLKDRSKAAVREYYSCSDGEEIVRCIFEICPPFFHYEVVKIIMNVAMDQDSKCRELASHLLGSGEVFSPVAIRRGLEILIARLDDINKDVPDGTALLSCFIARAIADEAIPPSFVQEIAYQPLGTSPHAITCLQKVQHLLSMKLSAQRLSHIWGPGRGRPVSELKEAIKLMLNVFFQDKDLNELATSLHDMGEPNFQHEFVKQAIVESADKGPDAVSSAIDMVKAFLQKELIGAYQVRIAVQRCENNMDNYKCDIPRLPAVLAQFKQEMVGVVEI